MAYQGSNNTIKPAAPCDLYREHILLNNTIPPANPAVYNPPAPQQVSDDFFTNSNVYWTPARYATNGTPGGASPSGGNSHTPDTQDYPAGNVRSDNWIEHVRGKRGVDTDSNSAV